MKKQPCNIARLLTLGLFLSLWPLHGADAPSVRVIYARNVLNAPLWVAIEQRLFEKHHVDVITQTAEQANLMATSLAAGDADISTGVSLLPMANLESQSPGRIRIVIHSKLTAAAPFDRIVAKKDSPITTLKDLAGKKVATYPGTTAKAILSYYLGQQGVDTGTVQFVAMPGSAHANALAAGAVDAAFAYEPAPTILLQSGQCKQVFGSIYAALEPNCPISVTVVARRADREKGEAVKRFTAALDEAVEILGRDPSAAQPVLMKYTNISAEVAKAVPVIRDTTSATTDSRLVQEFLDLLVKLGELPKPVRADALLAPTSP
jgi:NitT/TauT family transport system substrate-binding protein